MRNLCFGRNVCAHWRLLCLCALLLLGWQLAVLALVVRGAQTGLGLLPPSLVEINPPVLRAACAAWPPAPPPAPPPLRVHHLWRTKSTAGYYALTGLPAAQYADAWAAQAAASSGGATLWDDAAVRALLASPQYDGFGGGAAGPPLPLRAAVAALSGVRWADAARLLLLHAHGGVYADLDTAPQRCAAALPAALAEYDCALPLVAAGDSVSNYWLACRANSPFLAHALAALARGRPWWRRLWLLPYLDTLDEAGPLFLTAALRSYIGGGGGGGSAGGGAPARIALLGEDAAGEYVRHAAGRSWVALDGLALLELGERGAQLRAPGAALAAAALALACLLCARRAPRRRCCRQRCSPCSAIS